MFTNFRFFVIVGFIVMILLVITTGMYFRHSFREVFINNFIEREVEAITKQYEFSVYCPFAQNSSEHTEDFPSTLAYQTKIALGTTSTDAIRVYDRYRRVVFESFVPSKENEAFKAFKIIQTPKQVVAISNDKYKTTHWIKFIKRASSSNCETNNSNNKMALFIEYYYDVTELVRSVGNLQLWMSSGLVVVFGVLYLLIYITSQKIETLLQKQLKKRKGLEMTISQVSAENEAKSMFLASITHELRTPLNSIIGFSEMMRDEIMGPLGDEQYKEYANDINTSGMHLLSLINDILDYSKAEADRLEVEKIDVDLTKIINNCVRMLEPRAKEHNIKINANLPEEHIVMQTDPRRMKQVILNLLSNAVKFTPEGKTVSLRLIDDANKTVITITDEGIGLAPEDIPKALTPFRQIDNSLSKRYEGTGLGLPLTKKLTEIMGGEFTLTSGIDSGTEVELTFVK